ncbi:MAG: type III pantothenate kinase [Planctomycetes bacterium]|nr:type III pantothenate kinase [Planctomycetota bacterium]
MAVEPRLAYVLAADVGNTHVTLGAVRGDQVYVSRKLATVDLSGLNQALVEMWEVMDRPRRLVAASVNQPALDALKAAAMTVLEEPVSVVGEDIPLPIQTSLDEQVKIGTDRLCCAAAAYARLQQACVVVDLGTAVTVDCVDDGGKFIGGAILPGMKMQAVALHRGTAQLPEVEPVQPDWVFGRNTTEAIVGGIVYGVRGAVRAIVEAYATELCKWPLVITTGGDAELFGRDGELVQAIVPDLCLMGISLAFYQSLLPTD